MTQQVSPRGTFLEIAAEVQALVARNPEMEKLPAVADLMKRHGVSRGVVLRAFEVLRQEGVAEPVPGGRWRVVRAGEHVDRRPLHERIVDVVAEDGLKEGDAFHSASALADRFGVSRPTVTKALDKLEAAGVLASTGQGRVRTVRTVPNRKGRS
ncbi:GntR family transcriptional regulator [Streptomyces mesophilus]|uniref:GntR family transcriptional regulator n=1 Tax=Streptomyces mesophilus TaxID=1775132 RepID=UPI0033244CC2